MRIRKLAVPGLAAGVMALLFTFTPAQAGTEINGTIRFGHPGVQNGVGRAFEHACEERKNEDGTPNYDGFDGVWIDVRSYAPGTKLAVTMDPALDVDVYSFALDDQDEDGELDCYDTGADPWAPAFLGEGGTGEVLPGTAFLLVAGWAGTGKFTVTIG